MDLVEKYLCEAAVKPTGKAQKAIVDYLEALDKNYGHPYNMKINLNDIAAGYGKGIHYGKLQNAAKALAKKGYIEFDGFNVITAFLNPKYK